ncbi:MAG: hypothetical protein EXQ53_00015 [Acidobacteria bacterium]|nr:hypothetical protein [Acidobacteriota bacterium]
MPPRFVYWTIVAGGLPTAFRATEREELLPTFKRLQAKHPDAEMKYFARGKLWASQEEAKHDFEARRTADHRPEGRGRDWRPGGEHRDPRQKFKDAKKDRNLKWRKERFDHRQKPGATGPPAAPAAARPAQPEWRGRPPGAAKPQGEWRGRPPQPRSPVRSQNSGESPESGPRPPKAPFRPAKPPFRPSGPPDRARHDLGHIKNRRRRS